VTPQNLLDVIRFALTNERTFLGSTKTPKLHPTYLRVINYSRWLLCLTEWWRLSILGYSRKSITGYMARKSRYGPVIAEL
jgi:hypothetical protein